MLSFDAVFVEVSLAFSSVFVLNEVAAFSSCFTASFFLTSAEELTGVFSVPSTVYLVVVVEVVAALTLFTGEVLTASALTSLVAAEVTVVAFSALVSTLFSELEFT